MAPHLKHKPEPVSMIEPPILDQSPSPERDWLSPDLQDSHIESLNRPRIINGLWRCYQQLVRDNEVELRDLRPRAGVERALYSVPSSSTSSSSSSSSWSLPSIPEHPSQDEHEGQSESGQEAQPYPSREQIFNQVLIADMHPENEPPTYAAHIWDALMTIYDRQVVEIRALHRLLGLKPRWGISDPDSGHGSMSVMVRSGPDRERGEDESNWAPLRVGIVREDGEVVRGLQQERQEQQEGEGGTSQSAGASANAEADADAGEEGSTAAWQGYRYGDEQDGQGRSRRDGGKPNGGRAGPFPDSPPTTEAMEPFPLYDRHEYSPDLSPSESGESLPTDPTGQIELDLLDSQGHAYTRLQYPSYSGPECCAPPGQRRAWEQRLEECNSDPVPCGYLVFVLVLVVGAVATVIVVGVK
ncbi:hypothetical protein BDW69DRAFT_185328 [Aspergillus filifer]